MKLALAAQQNLYRAHERLGSTFSDEVATRLFLTQSLRVRLARHGSRVLDVAVVVAIVQSGVTLPVVLLGVAVTSTVRMTANVIDSRRARTFYERVTANPEHGLDAFADGMRTRTLRRARRHLPASVLGPHPHRDVVLYAMRLRETDLSETVLVLADEFDGTAYDLLETAAELERT